jgi:hypothetical protein
MRVHIDVCKDGSVELRNEGEALGLGLPVYTATDMAEAKGLVLKVCKMAYDNQTYIVPEFDGNFESLHNVRERFEKAAA